MSTQITNVRAVNKFGVTKALTQFKRELWEARGTFVRTPMWVAGILTGLLVLGIFTTRGEINLAFSELRSSPETWAEFEGGAGMLQALMQGDLFSSHPEILSMALAAISIPFLVVLLLVMQVYLLGCLHGDRRDKSILFWKSLPVSETQVVLTKLGFGMLAGPALFMLASLAVALFYLLLLLGFASLKLGISPPGIGQLLMAFGTHLMGLVSGWLLFALWSLPLMSWLLLASAYAKKTPFLISIGLPLGAVVLEIWVLGSFSLWNAMTGQLHRAFEALVRAQSAPTELFSHWGEALSSFPFWLGLVIAAGLLVGTIWLRNHRYET